MTGRGIGFALLVLLLATGSARAEKVTLRGKVVDAEGNPVAGAEAATMWDYSARGAVGFGSVKTDDQGEFELQADTYRGRPVALMILDAERKRGATTRFSQQSFGKARTLTLEPLVKVKGEFTCTQLGERPPWTNVYVQFLPGNVRFAQFGSNEARFEFLLPPGDYRLHMYGSDVRSLNRDQWVEGDEGEIDLKKIDLPATPIALLYGKKLPDWTVTDARGAEKTVKLADYKGKMLLIEFWGFW